MPRYFFDVHDGETVIDHDGSDWPDDEAAQEEATRALTELARDMLPGDCDRKTMHIVVRTAHRGEVLEVHLDYHVKTAGLP